MKFEFDPAKNEKLIRERGVSFQDAIDAFASEKIFTMDGNRPNQHKVAFWHQKDAKKYIFICITEKKGDTVRLVTIYPSKKYTKILEGVSI